jgi:hypothetical protein
MRGRGAASRKPWMLVLEELLGRATVGPLTPLPRGERGTGILRSPVSRFPLPFRVTRPDFVAAYICEFSLPSPLAGEGLGVREALAPRSIASALR